MEELKKEALEMIKSSHTVHRVKEFVFSMERANADLQNKDKIEPCVDIEYYTSSSDSEPEILIPSCAPQDNFDISQCEKSTSMSC